MTGTAVYLWQHHGGRVGVILLVVMVLIAVFAPLIAPYPPNE